MGIIIFDLITVLISLFLYKVSYKQMFKDLADRGFTVNKKVANKVYDKLFDFPILLYFVPIFNITLSIKRIISYNTNFELFKDTCINTHVAEPFREEENIRYLENPTASNAININTKKEKEVKKAKKIFLNDDSCILYNISEDDLYEIIRTYGPITNLNADEQYQRLFHVIDLYSYIIKKFHNLSDDEIKMYIKTVNFIDFSRFDDINCNKETIDEKYRVNFYEEIPKESNTIVKKRTLKK